MTAAVRATATAVITGIGVVTPIGVGVERYWAAALSGANGIGPLSRFNPDPYSIRLAGEVPDQSPHGRVPDRLIPQTDHMTRNSLVAAAEALSDADAEAAGGSDDVGAVTASTAGGYEFGQRELEKLWRLGPSHVSAYQSFAWFYAVNTGQISIRHGLRGSSAALVTDHAGGLDAIGHARRRMRRGTPTVLTGAVDGSLCPWGWVAQAASGRFTTEADPAGAYRPFSADASGAVPGEGGAILILEDERAAAGRGAPQVYGRIAGYGATLDRRGATDGAGLRRALLIALDDAGVRPGDVDVVFADAAATVVDDTAEATALVEVFGPRGVPVTAPKTMTGRLGAGAGALDVATALLTIRDGVVPPTVGTSGTAYPIDLVTGSARERPVRTAVVLGRGAHGFNSALVVTAGLI